MISLKNKVKTILKKVREESQGSSSTENSNVFDGVLGDSDCRIILQNCLKNLETRVTETFALANSIKKNQIKGTRKLKGLTEAVNSIGKKFNIMKRKDGRMMKSLSHYKNKLQFLIIFEKFRGKA